MPCEGQRHLRRSANAIRMVLYRFTGRGSKKPMTNTAPPTFPIIIGVTGHRDIAPWALPRVRKSVIGLLCDWKRRFGPALHVMTGLADGADQLVADVARRLSVPIIAVAPMPLDAYRVTLRNPDKFDRHWNEAALRLILPDLVPAYVANYPERQFEQLGVLLARRSHLLLTLWDGMTRPGVGTGAVVNMRLRGDHGAAAFHDSPMFLGAGSMLHAINRGPLLQIFTARAEQPDPLPPRSGDCFLSGIPPALQKQSRRLFRGHTKAISDSPDDDIIEWTAIAPNKVYDLLRERRVEDFEFIDRLNRQIGAFMGSDSLLYKRQRDYLLAPDIPAAVRRDAAGLMWLQAAADTAAQSFQRKLHGHFVPATSPWNMAVRACRAWKSTRHRPLLGAVFLFAAALPAAVLCFEAFAHLEIGRRALEAYLGIVIYTLLFQRLLVHRLSWQQRFQDYRAIAEALRVQLYWGLSGVSAAVSDHYLSKQSGELGWIQFALRGPALWSAEIAGKLERPCRTGVALGWIEDQWKYYRNSTSLHKHAAERGQIWTYIWLGAGIFMSLALWVNEFEPRYVPESFRIHHDIALALAVFFPALAACFSVSREFRAYEPHAHSYALMTRIFGKALLAARSADASGSRQRDRTFKTLVRELGREALAENAEWLMEHRNRKVEHKS